LHVVSKNEKMFLYKESDLGRFNFFPATVAEMGDRLATIDVGRKVGAAVG